MKALFGICTAVFPHAAVRISKYRGIAVKVYLLYTRNVIRQGLTYKFNYFMKLFSVFLKITIQYFIWKALLHSGSYETSAGSVNLDVMIPYIVVSSLMQMVLSGRTISNVDQKIRTGAIAMDLMKPINFKWVCFGEAAGQVVYQLIFFLVPIWLMAAATLQFRLPDGIHILLFALSFLNSFVLLFLMRFLLGLMGFWFTQVWILERFLNDFIKLFSGVLIPIWFFPLWLQRISDFLPFKYIYYAPISLFIDRLDSVYPAKTLLFQLIWIGLFYMLSQLVWRRAVEIVTIQGG